MKHKKFLSLALIGIIGLTTLLSGCGKKTSDEPKKSTVKKASRRRSCKCFNR